MKPHRILAEALAELDEAASWYEEQREGLGEDLVAEYRQRLASALDVPGAGALAGKTRLGTEVRRYRLKRFERFAILIAEINGVATVVAFEHSRRRPGYWRARVR